MNLQNIIEKALSRTEGVPNHERAARIVDFIEIAQDLAGETTSDIGRNVAITVQRPDENTIGGYPTGRLAEPPRPSSNLIVLPGDEAAMSLPRMMDQAHIIPSGKSSEPLFTVRQIEEYLRVAAPSYIDVELEAGKPPVRYARQIKTETYTAGNEGDGVVKLFYPDKGDQDCPPVLFTTSDDKIDVDAAVQECYAIARNRYSLNTEAKKVTARPAKQWVASLDSVMANGMGADADEGNAANSHAFRNPTPVLRPRL
jgi:hypothetical protein